MEPDRRAADAILRDAFVAIGRDCAAFDPERHDPLAWMARHVRDRATARGRGVVLPRRDDDGEPMHPGPPPEPARAPKADRRRLALALAALDERQVHALRRTFVGGLGYGALARVFGIPEGAARSEVRRALASVRQRLNEGKPSPRAGSDGAGPPAGAAP